MARPTAPASRSAVGSALDWAFFVFAGVAAIWLSVLVGQASLVLGWGELWFAVVYWALLAYLVLPRLHRILTSIYVPDYFIGRARTSDGLLGDPVNVAFLGDEARLHAAMAAAGWIRADDLSLTAGLRIVRSTVLRRSYPEAPVSPLLLFGRTQDFAYQQEVDGTPGKRHHVRFWRCPEGWRLPGGREAHWLAAGTYDRSVGFSLFTLQVTHKIAPRTDVERDHVVATVEAAVPAATTAVIRDFSTGYHARNGGGDSITTDGDLPVVDLRATPDAPTMPPTDSRDRRPAPTVVGAVLVTVRGLYATVLRRSYPEAPVSPLLLFGRTQDFAYQQEVDGTPGKRHHVRFWRCPDGWRLPGGREAHWLAAGSYDRSVGLSLFTLQVTHKIAPQTDAERDHVVATVQRAVPTASVSVIRDFSTGYHARNGGGDSIATDGDLPVIDLRGTPDGAALPAPTDSRDRRPAPTVVGAVLVTVRGLYAGLVLLLVVLGREEMVSAIRAAIPSIAVPAAQAVHLGIAIVLGALAVFELLVAWRILRGSNGARLIAMAVSTAAIVVQAMALVAGGPGITVQTNLIGLSLDILLLLALSSHRARIYALRPRKAPKRISGRPGDAAAL